MDLSPAEAGDSPDTSVKRACDQCRTRKIRCDKEEPCSNCRTANRKCSSTGVGQKPKESRQRVLISTQYERKIDTFEERLVHIESLLQQLTVSVKHGALGRHTPHSPGTASHYHFSPGASSGDLSHSRNSRHNTPGIAHAAATIVEASDLDSPDSEIDSATFEGNSSMSAQTQLASDFLEEAVTRTSLRLGLSPGMQSALNALRQLVGMKRQDAEAKRPGSRGKMRFPHQKPMPRNGLRGLPMPPVHVVVQLLREIKETPPITFTLICAFLTDENFMESCQKVYFATEDYSIAVFIIVNTGLYYLLQEKSLQTENEAQAAEMGRFVFMCRENIETALANLPLLLTPRMENVEALLLGASYAIESSRFSLAWQLNSAAAMMCMTLGWHRLGSDGPATPGQSPRQSKARSQSNTQAHSQTQSRGAHPDYISFKAESGSASTPPTNAASGDGATADDDLRAKSTLFWLSYMMDKGLALRFGRSSVIQDYDVTMPRRIVPKNPAKRPGSSSSASSLSPLSEAWSFIMNQWIAHAEISGRVYTELYSPAALHSRPAADRVQSAHHLVASLTQLAKQSAEMTRVAAQTAGTQNLTFEIISKSDEVSFWSTMCLVYRAIPSESSGFGSTPTSNPECVEAARRAIASHLECIDLTNSGQPRGLMKTAYLHWTILFSPFVPFISLFCHAIETTDRDGDLGRLGAFVNSLVPTDLSPAIEKLHRVCEMLYNVARLYVEAKQAAHAQERQQQQQHSTATLDPDHDMAIVGNDFDMYLSQLGFVQPVHNQHQQHQQHHGMQPAAATAHGFPSHDHGDMPGMGGTQPAQLGDWYSANRHIMGLMEEDLSGFQPAIL